MNEPDSHGDSTAAPHPLDDLLRQWENRYRRGDDVAAAELCRDRPELTTPLATRIDAARKSRLPVDTAALNEQFRELGYGDFEFHAEGGMGTVFRATQQRFGRRVAVKISHCRDPELLQRFRREATLTARLEHPGIVPIYDTGDDGRGHPFYAMRFIDQPHLQSEIDAYHAADRAERDRPGRQAALRRLVGFVVAVAKTIAYAHDRGVLHLDVKPKNIVVSKYGETMLLDWGLAEPFARDEHTRKTSSEKTAMPTDSSQALGGGTPAYCSPEQYARRMELYDRRTDVFLLGATLYHVLTGVAPFGGPESNNLVGRYPPPERVNPATPAALAAVCRKAMQAAADDRYADALGFAADLDRWLADEPVGAWREPWRIRAGRWVRRRRALVTGMVAALMVGFVSLAVASILLTQEYHRANRYLDLAKGTVAEYSKLVSTSDELKVLGLEGLRRRFLEPAVKFYQEIETEQPNNPNLKAERGQVLLRLADLSLVTSQLGQAGAYAEKSVTVFRDLLNEFPGDSTYLKNLAAGHRALAQLHFRADRLGEAQDNFQRALDIDTELVRLHPNDPVYEAELARDLSSLGQLFVKREDVTRGEECLTQALAYRQALAQKQPTSAENGQELAESYHEVALMYQRFKQPLRAVDFYQMSLQEWARLLHDFGDAPQYLRGRASALNNLGVIELEKGHLHHAVQLYQRSREMWSKLVAQNPDYASLLSGLGMSHGNIAITQIELGQPGLALPQVRLAITYQLAAAAKAPGDVGIREVLCLNKHCLAQAELGLGRYSKAVAPYQDIDRILDDLASQHKATVTADGRPLIPRYERYRSYAWSKLGGVLLHLGRMPEARAYLEKARDKSRHLAELYPEPWFWSVQAEACTQLARLDLQQKRPDSARAALREAIALAKKLHGFDADHPDAILLRMSLGTAYHELGVLYRDEGDLPQAKKFLNEALALRGAIYAERPEVWHAGLDLALSQACMGQYQPAAILVREICDGTSDQSESAAGFVALASAITSQGALESTVALPTLSRRLTLGGAALYEAAAALAQCARAADLDRNLADEYAAEAIGLLGQAQRLGYFSEAASVAYLKKDPDLKPLRHFAAYKAFLEQLKAND